MSRKPFSEVTESYFRNEMREPLVRGHDNRSAACLLANAAIAQDKEYALRRIREENHEGMIYYRERDQARAERDTLREENAKLQSEAGNLREAFDEIAHLRKENERLKMEYTEAETAFENLIQDYREGRDKAQVKLAEAIHIIEHYSECDADDGEEYDGATGRNYPLGTKARDFLAKHRGEQ